ncbi:putative AAA+ superfamily ATPase [Pararhizobium capsulatum DSM 1112]|uniref:AAA+ superfamily ATPase n=1 Tax=Pararhizobium capsulatum DSM 1112 TaxID=1121113 RepID=A0ABU0BVZ4_9HYPH|nr:ATP-binding protein [Pararhizobium capsulatum]MDQ0322426.1 putative AAA+ superfamily ATPase [Pararhizobium capsulatum DSM 1112]
MMIPRPQIETALESAVARAPVVALIGARQVGKTTLARKLTDRVQGTIYLDLERIADRRRLEDAEAFLQAQVGHLTVLDEVQRLPELFAELRGIVDDRRAGGERSRQFLLLGSASLDLIQQVSETLAGRIVYLEMPPIGAEEAVAASIDIDRLWLRGGFPDSLTAITDEDSYLWRQAFVRSYLERDVPMFAPRMPATTIGRLWTMLANGQGNTLNSARLAQGLGVSAPMIGRYVDLLVDLMLVRLLHPWSGNLGKRLVKSPKIYVRDSGLVHALLEIGTLNQLLGHPVVGPSWEGFVIETLINVAGPDVTPLFYRTADGAEIDLVFEQAGRAKVAIEVKRASAPHAERGFFVACDDLEIENRIVVGAGTEDYPAKGGVKVRTLLSAVNEVREILKSPFVKAG